MVDPVRIGLVGVGGMGAGHLEEEHGVVEEVRFTALCDVDKAALARQGQRYDLPTFDDYHALIDSGLCEAVLIATPHPFHAPVACYAAEHGVHVLSEKPIAVTVSQADAMLEAARVHGVVLGIDVPGAHDAGPSHRAALDFLRDRGAALSRVADRQSLVPQPALL